MPRLVIQVDNETLQALIEVAVEAGVSSEEAAAFLLREELVEGDDEDAISPDDIAPGLAPQVS